MSERPPLEPPVDGKFLAFDPREWNQRINQPSTWKRTNNPALVAALLVAHYNGAYDPAENSWTIEMANYCDEVIPT